MPAAAVDDSDDEVSEQGERDDDNDNDYDDVCGSCNLVDGKDIDPVGKSTKDLVRVIDGKCAICEFVHEQLLNMFRWTVHK